MLGIASLAAAALAGLSVVPAAAEERSFPTAERATLEDVYPERITRFSGGVIGRADVVYSVVPGYRPAIIDVYTPRSRTPKPLILYVHGGGWMGGHTRHAAAIANFPSLLASLAREGFVVASLEYRLAREAAFPAQLQDIRAAIRFLKANAARYGIDPTRAAIWGGSAGGHLAALSALSCGVASFDVAPAPAGSECVQGAVIWYGVFDFAPVVAADPARSDAGAPSPIPTLLACGAAPCSAEAIVAASPVMYLDASDPPFLLVHGEADRVVSVSQSHEMEARLRTTGIPVEALYFPGIDHSFVGQTPAETRAATLGAVNATFDFFHTLFGRPKS